jgi:hypothetical protein
MDGRVLRKFLRNREGRLVGIAISWVERPTLTLHGVLTMKSLPILVLPAVLFSATAAPLMAETFTEERTWLAARLIADMRGYANFDSRQVRAFRTVVNNMTEDEVASLADCYRQLDTTGEVGSPTDQQSFYEMMRVSRSRPDDVATFFVEWKRTYWAHYQAHHGNAFSSTKAKSGAQKTSAGLAARSSKPAASTIANHTLPSSPKISHPQPVKLSHSAGHCGKHGK